MMIFSVPFDFCERPPSISHGFMATQPENAYRIMTEVEYECHPGFRMKAQSKLKCHSTGCWTPNELPQCIREDLFCKILDILVETKGNAPGLRPDNNGIQI